MNNALPDNLIRLYADGEASEEQIGQVERHLRAFPADEERIEFERDLRQRVGQVMDVPVVPAGLADLIRARLEEATVAEPMVVARIGSNRFFAGASDDASDADAKPRRRRTRMREDRLSVFAIAASLALLAGAVLFSVLKPSFGPTGPSEATVRARIVEAASTLTSEHTMLSANEEALLGSLDFRGREQAARALSAYLATPVTIFDLSDIGYEFLGGGFCKVPHCPYAVHLAYRRVSDGALASVHLVVDEQQFRVADDPRLRTLPFGGEVVRGEGPSSGEVFVWSDGKLVFLLTAADMQTGEAIVRAMQTAS